MAEEPKKPVKAFFMYFNSNRATFTKEVGTAPAAVSKLASQTWSTMSDADKKPYFYKAAEAKIAYDKAFEAFKAAGGQARKRKTKEEGASAKHAKTEGCPKRPIGGGYGQFLADVRAELTDKLPAGPSRFAEVTKVAGQKWKALPADEKERYNKVFLEKQQAYKVEFDKFMKEQGDKENHKNGKDGEDVEEYGEDDEEDKARQ